jgi:hypothetical protein
MSDLVRIATDRRQDGVDLSVRAKEDTGKTGQAILIRSGVRKKA